MILERITGRKHLKSGPKKETEPAREIPYDEKHVEASRNWVKAYLKLGGNDEKIIVSWMQIEEVIEAEKRLVELKKSDLDIIQQDYLKKTNFLTYPGLKNGANFFYRRAEDFTSKIKKVDDHENILLIIRQIGACFDAGDFLNEAKI
jgi:hypothetical protein